MLQKVLNGFRDTPRYSNQITAWHTIPPSPAQFSPWPSGLDPVILEQAREKGITSPWTHQAQAIEAALSGENVVLMTPTASGKTLCYNLPVFQTLLRDPSARALYLFPTKALAYDQLEELKEWMFGSLDFSCASYDGDTPRSIRGKIRKNARIVLTNPDMLHAGVLPYHTQWAETFSRLRFVILDEIHVYRGVLGSHVANVLRRLKRIARFYGSSPRFVCCSATIANPVEHARSLIEEEVKGIDEDGAPKGERHFIFYNPPLVEEALGIRRSVVLETQQIAQEFISSKVQTIVFAQTRQGTELLVQYLQAAFPLPSSPGGPNASHFIRGYRGGYRPDERRAIEKGLRTGEIRAVVSTNALELGIDIGQLDACLMAGYPGTIAATWQRVGRAGRNHAVSVALLVAGSNPLDQYMVRHPHYFLGQSPERVLIDPDHLSILVDHLRCAAFELPLGENETFGTPRRKEGRKPLPTRILIEWMAQKGQLHQSGTSYHWAGESPPSVQTSIRGSGEEVTILEVQPGNEARSLGTLEKTVAPTSVHPGAIYLHDGSSYRVEKLDLESGEAWVTKVEADYYTLAHSETTIRSLETIEKKSVPGAEAFHGEVEVTSRPAGFRKLRMRTHETLEWGEIDLAPRTWITRAYWFEIAEETVAELKRAGWWNLRPGGYRGPNWKDQRKKARERDNFRCRQCGAPEKPGRQHDLHHIRPFRLFGYVPGQNHRYREANELENLVTLCPSCHRLAENGLRFQGALGSLGYALGHVAPLFLMCDAHDLGLHVEFAQPFQKPTVTLYETVGIGFSEALFHLHASLVGSSKEMIEQCPCEHGCPSCIGPIEPSEQNVKRYTLAILHSLSEKKDEK